MGFGKFFKISSLFKVGTKAGNDRRKFQRFSTHNLIRFQVSDQSQSEWIANLLNWSEGGIQFFHKNEMDPGALLKFEIHVPLHEKPLKVTGKVIWCKQDKRQSGYAIGVSFLDLSEADRAVIRELCK